MHANVWVLISYGMEWNGMVAIVDTLVRLAYARLPARRDEGGRDIILFFLFLPNGINYDGRWATRCVMDRPIVPRDIFLITGIRNMRCWKIVIFVLNIAISTVF